MPSSTIEGGRGCNIFVPVLGGNGTKIAPTGDIFDQPPGQMRWIRDKLADHIGDRAVSSPEGAVLVTSPGMKSSYPPPPIVEPLTEAKAHAEPKDNSVMLHWVWYRIRQVLMNRECTTPVLSACPLHTDSGCGKERRILIGPWWPAKAALVRNYLEVYWPCAGGLSAAVNAIGTQLREPINLGLARWRIMAVLNN